MPELPEVETVRLGLDRFVVGARIAGVEVRHPRSIRRHVPGAADFAARLTGMRIAAARRRGKYLWLPLESVDAPTDPIGADSRPPIGGGEALIAHLGMSGQLLVRPATAPDERHLHVRIELDGDGRQLRFVDQRTFGGLMLDTLEPSRDLATDLVPAQVAHIARDPVDPHFDDDLFVRRLRTRRTEVKRALLDQSLVSGIGNIYADEALWRARLSGLRITSSLAPATVRRLLASVREVLDEALVAGGTSFDAMYVNVNGESGYFSRSLAVYGREGQPCGRCGRPIRRAAFMNRSSFSCPSCQLPPLGIRTS